MHKQLRVWTWDIRRACSRCNAEKAEACFFSDNCHLWIPKSWCIALLLHINWNGSLEDDWLGLWVEWDVGSGLYVHARGNNGEGGWCLKKISDWWCTLYLMGVEHHSIIQENAKEKVKLARLIILMGNTYIYSSTINTKMGFYTQVTCKWACSPIADCHIKLLIGK